MTLSDVISEARKLLNDTDTPYRYSDADLVAVGNQVVKRILNLRPDLFAAVGTVTCVADDTYQSAPSDSFRIIDILRVVGGPAISEVDRQMLNDSDPSWVETTSGEATEWMRHPRNPNKFFVYPPAVSGQQLIMEYAKIPADYAIDATMVLSDSYLPVMVDGVVWIKESVDDEHVNSNRAQMFMQSFYQGLGVTLESRVMTDNEDAAVGKTASANG